MSYGTSLHLRITDPNGINVDYGNTVKLYNSAGVLVATQIINPQSGMGVNHTGAGQLLRAECRRNLQRRADQIHRHHRQQYRPDGQHQLGWFAGYRCHSRYDLSAEAGTASNNGKFVGTGYNDTFFATAGTDTYDGSGGWVTAPAPERGWRTVAWYVVDFRLSTVGVTANLSVTTAQATGFQHLDIYQYRRHFRIEF